MNKKSAKPKSELWQLSEEFKRHTGALIEHVDDVFKLTNEEIRGIHQKLDSHTQVLDSHTRVLDSHTQVLNSHTQVLNSHTQMIGQIMMDIEQIKFDLKQKVSYDDFARLEKRVAKLELSHHQ
ncbi:MAG TPA: hypothetical protein VJI73_01195 [Candidatus Paceibacterota bacterium]